MPPRNLILKMYIILSRILKFLRNLNQAFPFTIRIFVMHMVESNPPITVLS